MGLLVVACGAATQEAEPPPRIDVAAEPEGPAPLSALKREDVDRAIDAGLGYFLQHVAVEPDVVSGKFRGFRIVQMTPDSYWQGVELFPGDVVTSVNGMPIGRETEAYAAFQALRQAKELRVAYIREGEARELVLPIVGAPRAAAAASGAAAVSSASAAPASGAAPAGSAPRR